MQLAYIQQGAGGWTPPASAAETVILFAAGGSNVQAGPGGTNPYVFGQGQVDWCTRLNGYLSFTPGAGTTAVVLRGRLSAAVTGAQFGNAITYPVTPGTLAVLPYEFFVFTPWASAAGPNSWCLTMQNTGQTAAGASGPFTFKIEV